MSDNHPPADPTPVHISNSPAQVSVEAISNQCTRAKTEMYKLTDLVKQHPHQEARDECLRQCQWLYEGFQKLQTFIQSR